MAHHIYISTGELSGESHAARLVEAYLNLQPNVRFTGMGGAGLRAVGVDTVIDLSEYAVVGFMEVVRHLPTYNKAFRQALLHIEETQPDIVILVDYPGFHLRLAAAIKRKNPNVRILYYIAPKVWAWNERRVEKLRQFVDQVLCIFPFEEEYFAQRGVKARYVGNPTMDAMRDQTAGSLRDDLRLNNDTQLVAVFPGSRRKEIERILPPMLDALRLLQDARPEVAAAISAVPGYSRREMSEIAKIPESITVVSERNLELLAASQLVLAKSGTTTLEAALIGVPMVVVYKSNWLSVMIARKLVKLPYFSLPNILAQRCIVTELLQEQVTGAAMHEEMCSLLDNETRAAVMKRDLLALRETFGDTPAAEATAIAVAEFRATG